MGASILAAIASSAYTAATATTAATLAGSATAAAIATAVINAALVMGASLGLQMLAASPKKPGDGSPATAGTQANIKQAISNWPVVYGQSRVGGIITFEHTTGNNALLHYVLTITGHPVEELGSIYFNEYLVPFNEQGYAIYGGDPDPSVIGWQGGYARVFKGDGTDEGDAELLAALRQACPDKWTESHRQRGCAKLYFQIWYNPTLMDAGFPLITCVVKGRKVFDPRNLGPAVVSSATGSPGVFTTSAAHGLSVGQYVYLGNHTALGGRASITGLIDGNFIVGTVPSATTFTLNDCSFPVTVLSAGVGGNVTPLAWSSNPALVIRDYMADRFIGPNILSTEIDDAVSGVTGANVCEEYVTLPTNSVAVSGITVSNPTVGGVVVSESSLTFSTAVAWPTGTPVFLTTTGTLPTGFTAGLPYYAINSTPGGLNSTTVYQISDTQQDALLQTVVPITDAGTGTLTVSRATPFTFGPTGIVTTVFSANTDPLDYETISSTASETITTGAFGFCTGDKVQLVSTGTLPTGLSSGTTYYWCAKDHQNGMLATSLANAQAGIPAGDFGSGCVLAITMIDDGTSNGTYMMYSVSVVNGGSGYSAPTVLLNTGYLGVNGNNAAIDPGTISLTVSGGSVTGAAITDPGTGWMTSTPPTYSVQDSLVNAGTGTHAVYLTAEMAYSCHGMVDTTKQPLSIIPQLLSSMAGKVAWTAGQYVILPGYYRTPTTTITRSDLIGPINLQTTMARRDLFNSVKGTFMDPTSHWQANDFPPVQNTTYITQDQGLTLWTSIDLGYTQSASMSQRLASISLETCRRQMTLTLSCKLTVLGTRVGDVVMVTDERFGWDAKTFEVIDWTFSSKADGNGVPFLAIDLMLRETDSSVYAWTAAQTTISNASPRTNLPNPFTVLPPASVTVTESISSAGNTATLFDNLVVNWGASPDGFVTRYDAQWSVSGANSWTAAGTTLAPNTNLVVVSLPAGTYDVRVAAINAMGAQSAWTVGTGTLAGVPTSSVYTVPPCTGLELAGQGNNTIFNTPDAQIDWRWTSTTGSFAIGHETYADTGWLDSYFAGFVVRIYDFISGNCIRTEPLQTASSYTYTLAKNVADTKAHPLASGDTARREFGVGVTVQDIYGRTSTEARL